MGRLAPQTQRSPFDRCGLVVVPELAERGAGRDRRADADGEIGRGCGKRDGGDGRAIEIAGGARNVGAEPLETLGVMARSQDRSDATQIPGEREAL